MSKNHSHDDEGRLSFTSGLHDFGSNLSNNVTSGSALAIGSTSSSQNYTDLSLSHLANSWNQQQGGGGPNSGQNNSTGGPGGPCSGVQVGGGSTNTPSISLSAAVANLEAVTSSNPGAGGNMPQTAHAGQHHNIPLLSITGSTLSPPSNTLVNAGPDGGIRVKAEPLSPRDLHHPGLSNIQQLHPLQHPAQLQRPHSANSALSSHLSPNNIGQGKDYSITLTIY